MSFFKLFTGDPISIIVNVIIIALAIGVFLKLYRTLNKLKDNDSRSSVLFDGRSTSVQMNKDASMKIVTHSNVESDDINKLKKEYDEICIEYNTCQQLIPIFPSLGILGTVLGLMVQLSAQGVAEMTNAIALALSTTLVALIATILLKIYVANCVSKVLYKCEVRYRDYDRSRQDLVDKIKLNEE
ncbi:MAG: MotA/TolQ/ExbB proton channel family protein [Pseudobutyrivibrio sp.]|uniref:MotA/TolQ/ExbB proton channel family protein n=1 Tax=Pseudobutyrivibrio sp. TaxID=2014367 RepID=UPI0025E1FA3C|nr:MotA/TolQ/ExbB proton channel family protein [Pseudobutyrivibrio sp.]MBQ6462806.1 MotA/TolQ/ExbB proton channel family protein [Pseudobutyrivibrio sp.]